jgi:hypothetical protein
MFTDLTSFRRVDEESIALLDESRRRREALGGGGRSLNLR